MASSELNKPKPTPGYEAVISTASRLAAELGHDYVSVEHLLLAILRDPRSMPTQVLAKLVDIHHADVAICEVMASDLYKGLVPPPPPPPGWPTPPPPGEDVQ